MKTTSEVTPGILEIQIQIQAVCGGHNLSSLIVINWSAMPATVFYLQWKLS